SNVAKQEKFKGDFEKLSTNYETEGTRLINTIINTEGNVSDRFKEFTYAFTAYSKTQNPQFGLIYVLDYNGTVHIGNYLKDEITVAYFESESNPQFIGLTGCFDSVQSSVSFGALTNTFTTPITDINLCVKEINEPYSKPNKPKFVHIIIKNSWYPFELIQNKPQLMMVSRMEQEEQRKVFIGGEGFAKEGNMCKELTKQLCEYAKAYCVWVNDTCKPIEESIAQVAEGFGGKLPLNEDKYGRSRKSGK
ncbi:MAG: hypothetical protein QXR60_04330, partial [Candidatus Nanoarchaeia archaeon]